MSVKWCGVLHLHHSGACAHSKERDGVGEAFPRRERTRRGVIISSTQFGAGRLSRAKEESNEQSDMPETEESLGGANERWRSRGHSPSSDRFADSSSDSITVRMTANRSGVEASNLRTKAGCVLDARMRPHPSSKLTRIPSIVTTSRIVSSDPGSK